MRFLGYWAVVLALVACGGTVAPVAAGPGGSGTGSHSDAGSPDAGPGDGADGGSADAGPSADCAGVVPASVGSALSFDLPGSAGKACSAAASDGKGMMIAESHDAGTAPAPSDEVVWNIFDVRGAWQGNFRGGAAIFPQPTGFAGTSGGYDAYWDAYGTPKNFVAVDARPVLAAGYSSGTVAFGYSGTSGLGVHRVDAAGNETAAGTAQVSGSFAIQGGAEEKSGAVVVLLAAGAAERFIWFDPSLRVSVAGADLGASAHEAVARPLLGGGVAIRLDGRWTATLRPGDAALYPPPAFLASGSDFAPARGGQAYAVWTAGSNAISLVSAGGNTCGAVSFAGASSVGLGLDGTVLGAASGGCTKLFWPAALK